MSGIRCRAAAGMLSAAMASAGCAGAPQRPADAMRPQPVSGTVDFSALFNRPAVSASVYSPNRERGLMDRVLLSPNLVFEASRSSLPDPATTGPDNPGPLAPNLPNALGTPVAISMSSALIRYLQGHGSAVIAPVVSRLWCGNVVECPQATWVERSIMLSQAAAAGSTEAARGPAPTSLLAVRSIGIGTEPVPLVVDQVGNGQYSVRVAFAQNEGSHCPDLQISLPMFTFSAEIVALPSGTVAARIHETRSLTARMETTARIMVTDWTPVEGQTTRRGISFSYIERYDPRGVVCNSIAQALNRVRASLSTSVDDAALQELLRSTLEPMYGGT